MKCYEENGNANIFLPKLHIQNAISPRVPELTPARKAFGVCQKKLVRLERDRKDEYIDAGFWVVGGYGMFHNEMLQGGKKAVEDKWDYYAYLDNVEGFSRKDAEWELHDMAQWGRRGEADDIGIERMFLG
jgi:hypothetical protein